MNLDGADANGGVECLNLITADEDSVLFIHWECRGESVSQIMSHNFDLTLIRVQLLPGETAAENHTRRTRRGRLPNEVRCIWNAPNSLRTFSTAVSLHGHTLHSRESLHFIPTLAARNSVLHWLLQQQERRCKKVPADFANAYWTPPLSAAAALEVERSQIENSLNLASIVSLTDHDNIEAPQLLRELDMNLVPISLEWTLPFDDIELHVGVHNLPANKAENLVSEMRAYTENPCESRLSELLRAMDEIPDVLLVLNHPMWDISFGGPERHRRRLKKFLLHYNAFVHAFELNGTRSWEENQAVQALARSWGHPVISGGDRHGREPSAVLNLTRAASMSEFVNEVREDGTSYVLFMPQYQESLKVRIVQTVVDVVEDYPMHPLGRNWDDRIFHPDRSGAMQPLSALWDQPPQFIKTILSALRLLETSAVRGNVHLFRSRSQESRQLSLRPGGEAA